MPDQAGRCLPEWTAAKKAFEAKTDQKKPSKKFLGIRLGTGVESALEAMDKAYDVTVKEADPAKRLKLVEAYIKKLEDFSKHRKEYKKLLEKAALDEANPEDYKAQIEIMNRQLSATEAGARANAQTVQIQAETQLKNGGKATANDKQSKERELALVQVQKMVPSLKSAVKNGALFAAQVKAEPTP